VKKRKLATAKECEIAIPTWSGPPLFVQASAPKRQQSRFLTARGAQLCDSAVLRFLSKRQSKLPLIAVSASVSQGGASSSFSRKESQDRRPAFESFFIAFQSYAMDVGQS
jgi:hypothetical protein